MGKLCRPTPIWVGCAVQQESFWTVTNRKLAAASRSCTKWWHGADSAEHCAKFPEPAVWPTTCQSFVLRGCDQNQSRHLLFEHWLRPLSCAGGWRSCRSDCVPADLAASSGGEEGKSARPIPAGHHTRDVDTQDEAVLRVLCDSIGRASRRCPLLFSNHYKQDHHFLRVKPATWCDWCTTGMLLGRTPNCPDLSELLAGSLAGEMAGRTSSIIDKGHNTLCFCCSCCCCCRPAAACCWLLPPMPLHMLLLVPANFPGVELAGRPSLVSLATEASLSGGAKTARGPWR